MDRYLSLTGLTAPECVALAPVAEAAGFAGVALSDHLVLPDDLGTYPNAPDGKVPFTHSTPWPDVWVAIGAMAAVTTTLRFRTTVLLLPLRHPIVVARAVGTAACLAPGRVEVGVGLGWLAGEYEVVGVDFARRGRLLEESIAALRALWGPGPAHHAGEEWSFGPVHLEPTPPVVPPFLIGAGAPRALRRAATLGDGYIVPGVPFDRSIELIGE
ncbi:MAG: TIGR03619 family F420-dependent LLM class oxidoreductase, partial [Acidimicrobiia bacterium]